MQNGVRPVKMEVHNLHQTQPHLLVEAEEAHPLIIVDEFIFCLMLQKLAEGLQMWLVGHDNAEHLHSSINVNDLLARLLHNVIYLYECLPRHCCSCCDAEAHRQAEFECKLVEVLKSISIIVHPDCGLIEACLHR